MSDRTKVGEFFLQKPRQNRYNDSEVAAWWTEMRFEPQVADVMADIGERNGRQYVGRWGYRLNGKVTDEYHGALFGGVPIGNGPYVPQGIGKDCSWSFSGEGYGLAAHFTNNQGRTDDGVFIPTVPLHITARSTTWKDAGFELRPNPACMYCGEPLRYATKEEREAVKGILSRPEYMHVDPDLEGPCKRDHPVQGWRPNAAPAQDQWVRYDRPMAHFELWFGESE